MHEYVVVDAFTANPLQGNPVAVVFGTDDLPASTMQKIAREFQLSETVFVGCANGGPVDANIRIFTPVNELAFAGHPLLGCAVAIGSRWRCAFLRVGTKMGEIECEVLIDSRCASIVAQHPIPEWRTYSQEEALLRALSEDCTVAPVEEYRIGPRHVIVVLESLRALENLEPDQCRLAKLPNMAAICVAAEQGGWRMRMFSPAYGVVEDAATGSAAGPVAIHLARHGLAGWNEELPLRQGVEMGRQSTMRVCVEGDSAKVSRVSVAGDGVVVAEGKLRV